MSELTPDKQVNLSIAQPSVLSADARGLSVEKSLDQEIPDEVPAQAATRSLKELLDPDNSAQQKHWLQMAVVGLLFLGIISGAIVALTRSNDPSGQSAITQDLNSKIKEQQGSIQADSALHINLDTIIEDGKEFTTTGRLVLKNSVNSTTAFLIQNASGNNLLSADTANNRIDISGLLAVEGNITSGGQLVAGNSSLDTQSLRINNVVICDATGCIPSPAATGTVDLSNLNASNITSGTLNDARLSGSVTLQGNIFNGPNQLVQLDGSGKLPTGLLGSDAATLSASQTFTGQNIFRPATNTVTAFQIQNAAGTSNLFVADTLNNRLGIGTNSPSATLSVVGTGLIQQSSTAAPALTVSGNEITDASRALAIQGDGRTVPDSSYGVWQGSTNQVNNGGFESNTNGWIAYTVGSASISRDTAQEKFGSASLQVVTGGLAVGEGAATGTNGTIGLPGVTNHTVSAWVRGTGTVILSVREYDSTNSFLQQQNSGPVTLTSSWQRIVLSFTSHANAALGDVLVITSSSQATTFWVDGVQLEQLPVATPYVETAGSPTLRNHARLRGPSAVLDEAQSWVAFRIRPQVVSNNCFGTGVVRLFEWAEDDANRILLSYSCTSSRFEAHRIDNNFATVPLVNASYNAGDNLTVIMAWTATQVKLSVNGSAFTVQAGAFIPDLSAINQFDLGSSFGINSFLNGEIIWFAAGTGTLTDADPPLINGFGNTDPNMASFGAPAATSIVWQARTANYFDSNFQPIIMNVQNSLGASLFSVDANDSAILLPGATSSSAALVFGNDVNLYRSAANTLKTDDNFIIQTATNSTNAFQIQDTGGTSNLFIADTVNSRIGIGAAPTSGATVDIQRTTAGQGVGIQVRNMSSDAAATSELWAANDTGALAQLGIVSQANTGSYGLESGDWAFMRASAATSGLAFINGSVLNPFSFRHGTLERLRIDGNGQLQLPVATSSTTGLLIGGDVTLYRSAANTLSTDDNLFITGQARADSLQIGLSGANGLWGASGTLDLLAGSGIRFGTTSDTNLYRSAADTLKTDDNFIIQTATNSTNAFQIQNAAGTSNLFIADTTNSRIGIGVASPIQKLDIGGNLIIQNNSVLGGKNSAGTGFQWYMGAGGASNTVTLYTGDLASPNAVLTATNAQVAIGSGPAANSVLTVGTNTTAASGGITFGTDVNLYRSASNSLRTDDEFIVSGNPLTINGGFLQGIRTNGTDDFLKVQLGAEGFYRFQSDASGKFLWGDGSGAGDTNLYRSAANFLKTDDSFEMAGQSITISNIAGELRFSNATSSSDHIRLINSGGGSDNFHIKGDGKLEWGSGSAATDTNLYRSAINTLKTDDNFSIQTATNSTTAFQVQNSSGGSLLTIDTSNTNILLGTGGGAQPNLLWGNAPTTTTISRTFNSPDTGNNNWGYVSAAIGTDGLPIYSYMKQSVNDLRVAKCLDAACSSVTGTSVDTNNSGWYSSIAMAPDGLPVISYRENTAGDLYVAKCGNAACSSGNTVTNVISASDAGYWSSIAIGADGLPVIAYHDGTSTSTTFLKCGNAACSSGNTTTVIENTGSTFDGHITVTVPVDGKPVVAYQAGSTLKVAKCGNAACSSGNTTSTIDTSANPYSTSRSTIKIGSDGLPIISYVHNATIKVAKCGNAACSSGNTITTVATEGQPNPSMAIGSDSLPVIGTADSMSGDIKVIKCGNAACSSGNITTTVDTGGGPTNSDMVIGSDGLPYLFYNTGTGAPVKILRCASQDCAAVSGTALTAGSNIGSMAASAKSLYFETLNLGKQNARVSLNDQGNFFANALQATSSGSVLIGTNSTTAFQIQNSSGTNLFSADTTNARITLGAVDANTPTLLVLGTRTNAGDPSCTNGAIYYNSSSSQFRGCANSNWTSLGENKPAVRAYHNAAQSITSSLETVIALNSENFDTDTMHDNVTNNSRLTCKTAGKYLITAQIVFAPNSTGYRYIVIMVNGSTRIANVTQSAITAAGDNTNLIATTIWDCAVNDYIEVLAWQNSGGNLDVSSTGSQSPVLSMTRIAD